MEERKARETERRPISDKCRAAGARGRSRRKKVCHNLVDFLKTLRGTTDSQTIFVRFLNSSSFNCRIKKITMLVRCMVLTVLGCVTMIQWESLL